MGLDAVIDVSVTDPAALHVFGRHVNALFLPAAQHGGDEALGFFSAGPAGFLQAHDNVTADVAAVLGAQARQTDKLR